MVSPNQADSFAQRISDNYQLLQNYYQYGAAALGASILETASNQTSVSTTLGKRAFGSMLPHETLSGSGYSERSIPFAESLSTLTTESSPRPKRAKNKILKLDAKQYPVKRLSNPGISNETIAKILCANPYRKTENHLLLNYTVLNEITRQSVSLENFFEFIGSEQDALELKYKITAYVHLLRKLPELSKNTGLGIWNENLGVILGGLIALKVYGRPNKKLSRNLYSFSLEGVTTRRKIERYFPEVASFIANNQWKIKISQPEEYRADLNPALIEKNNSATNLSRTSAEACAARSQYFFEQRFKPDLSKLPPVDFFTKQISSLYRDATSFKTHVSHLPSADVITDQITRALRESSSAASAITVQPVTQGQEKNSANAVQEQETSIAAGQPTTQEQSINSENSENAAIEQEMLAVFSENGFTNAPTNYSYYENSTVEKVSIVTDLTNVITQVEKQLTAESISNNASPDKNGFLADDSWIENFFS